MVKEGCRPGSSESTNRRRTVFVGCLHFAKGGDIPDFRVRFDFREVLFLIEEDNFATGAIERPLVFGNNDAPGILTASALTTYLNRYGVACGKRILLLTSNDHIYQGACDLAKAGCDVTIADTRASINPEWEKRARAAGVDILAGYGIAEAHGRRAVKGAHLVRLDGTRNAVLGNGPFIPCDALGSSGGLSPTVH